METFSAIQFIGTQRSGSNLLRVMLNQLPEITAPHPPHILKTFFPILSQYGDLSVEHNFYLLAKDVCDWVNLNPVPWERISLTPEVVIAACRQKSLIELFRRIHDLKASADNARCWCCKSMESIYYTKEIELSGINPIYVHLYRDGRDVALSFLKAIVGPKHIYHLANKWNEEQVLSLELKKKISPERFISIKYENLIENPREIIMDICQRIGVEYNDSVLDYFHSNESFNTAHSGSMWRNVVKPILYNNHHKYLKELSIDDTRIFEFAAGDMLSLLGYERITDITDVSITSEGVARFNQLNQEGIEQALLAADADDIERRRPQEELLKRIKSRML